MDTKTHHSSTERRRTSKQGKEEIKENAGDIMSNCIANSKRSNIEQKPPLEIFGCMKREVLCRINHFNQKWLNEFKFLVKILLNFQESTSIFMHLIIASVKIACSPVKHFLHPSREWVSLAMHGKEVLKINFLLKNGYFPIN